MIKAGGVPNAWKSNVPVFGPGSGERLRNTCVPARLWGIPAGNSRQHRIRLALAKESRKTQAEGRAAHQVVGGVTAHQAGDGSLVCEDGQPDWHCDTAQTPTRGSSNQSPRMDASLRQKRRVEDDGLRVVNSFSEG